jgi:predicted MFS family arabinose efflux permease
MGVPEAARPTRPAFPWLGLIILAAASFVSITSEFLPTGLLPQMAEGLSVSESRIGLLVSVFAATVVLTAAPLAALTVRFPRKHLVVVVLVAYALTNVLCAIAPNFEVMLAARVLGGVANGLFWAVVGAYTAHLVSGPQLARAVAVTGTGGALAFILGVPVGTAVGQLLGWRNAFAIVALAVVVLIALIALFLPAVNHRPTLATGEIALPARRDPTLRGVLVLCLITTVLITGQNIFYTFIVPFFTTAAGFPPAAVAPLLLGYGLGGAAGLAIVGLVGHRYPRGGLLVGFGIVAVAVLLMGVFPLVSWVVILAVLLWGAAIGGAPALLQTRLLAIVSVRLRDVSSAYMATSFNIGIGGGALIGSLLHDAFGVRVLPFVDIAFIALGLLLIVLTDRITDGSQRRPVSEQH